MCHSLTPSHENKGVSKLSLHSQLVKIHASICAGKIFKEKSFLSFGIYRNNNDGLFVLCY